MLDHRDRVCVPIEVEMVPLYREPGSGPLRRAQRREVRRRRRARLARLFARARGQR